MTHFSKGVSVFATLVALDQLSKLAARVNLVGTPFAELPYLSLEATTRSGLPFGLGGGSAMNWSLAAVGVLLLGLLAWGGHRMRTVEGAEGFGWWLAAAGVLGNLIDRLWLGGVVEFLRMHLGGPVLALNLADLLLLGGALLLLSEWIEGARAPQHTQLPPVDPPVPFPDLGTLPRGIDNVRIDVRLSPQFVAVARRLVSSLVYQQVGHERYGAKPAPPTKQEFKEFRGAYGQLLTGVTREAKRENRPQLAALQQFATLKFLLDETGREFEAQIGHLRGVMASGSMVSKGGRRMLLHQHITSLAQRRKSVEQDVCRQLIDEIQQVERGPGTKLRESLLGRAWLIDETILFNPLLTAADPHDPLVAIRHYVLLGKRTSDWEALRRFEGHIERLFDRLIPKHVHPVAHDSQQWLAGSDWQARAERLGLGLAEADFEHNVLTDVTANIDLLFSANYLKEWLDQLQGSSDRETVTRIRAQQRLQQLALRRAVRYARREGLLEWIVAAYELIPVYRQHYAQLNPLLLVQYLGGGSGRGAALQQIRQVLKGQPPSVLKPLYRLRARLRRLPYSEVTAYVRDFIRDFLTYRRDLGNYYMTQGLLEQIRLLDEPDDIRLSRVNNCLQELLSGQEDAPKRERIRAHTIVKADLRGSTTVTRQLLEQGLNPATHFDQAFFSPIRDLLRTFGAEKVFVEGDAIIAAVLEYDDDLDSHQSVARACGMARRIIGVAEAHLRMLETQGLPGMQVGIGIAYSAESPTYLFDGDQPIMISSAIGRSDRLSSSSWRLRELAAARESDGRRVRVYEFAHDHPLRGEKGEVHLRYNVAGIELEQAAFDKLRSEIDMRKVEFTQPGRAAPARFHVGRIPDLQAAVHQVVIRESPILYYGLDGPGDVTGESYLEVVTDQRLLRLVEQQADVASSTHDTG